MEKEKKKVDKKHDSKSLPLRLRNSAIHRKYTLKNELSTDFAGTLYATAKKNGGKGIAVKVLKEGYALLSNTLGNIEHSRICQILHTIIERETIQAVVLEKPEGTPLSQMIKEGGRLPPGQVVSAGLQLLSALHAVHWTDAAVGNLHSDSIFLSRDRQGNLELQLTNLGIGCVQDKFRETDYLAPEQIMGGKGVGQAADIWAVGAILYEMLTGKRPFNGENRYAVAGEILLQSPDFSAIPKNIPQELVAIIQRAMDKDESKRFGNVAEMVSELLPFQSEFNEPMSYAAKSAIRRSYPPEEKSDRPSNVVKTAAKTSDLSPPARVIPTVRISHTPNDPPQIGQKTGNLLRDDPNRIGKQTKMGMPAIALPAKRIPLKSSEDTATFTQQSRSSNGVARQLSNPDTQVAQGKGTAGRALSVVTKTMTMVRDTLSVTITKTIPNLIANPPKPAELKRKIASLSLKTKLAAAGAVVFLVLLSMWLGFSGDSSAKSVASMEMTAKQLRTAIKAAYKAEKTDYLAKLSSQPPIVAPTIQMPTVPDKKVTIRFSRKIPSRWRVRLNGKAQKRLPIVIPATDVPAIVTIHARGFKTFSQVILPLDDMTVEVDMEQESSSRRSRSKRSSKKSKSKKKKENLASNPFG